jgi:poly(glycerol-phosphate) alpha-glucosyltransferase
MVKDLGLADSVQINSYVEDVPAVYRAAGLSILTSRNEGYPLGIMESLAAGCPVVAFDVRYGPSEMIEDGINGFLVSFENEGLLVERIVALLSDVDLHRAMSENAVASVARFGRDSVAERWRTLISELVYPVRSSPRPE